MKNRALILNVGFSLALAGAAYAAPAGPPAGNPILNTHIYQRGSEMNIDTATIRTVSISTFTSKPSLPLGIKINGADYNSTTGSDISSISLNVKDFGATGRGAADDRPAIMAAITAVSSPTCGTAYLPNGHYLISNTIYWPACVRIVGESREGTVIITSTTFPSGENLIQTRNTDGSYYSYPNYAQGGELRDMSFDGSHMPSGFGYGIAMDTRDFGLIDNVRVSSTPKSGIYTGGINFTGRVRYPTVRHVILDSTGWDGGADQLGGGGLFGARYSDITCINSPGTCIDQVDTISGIWENVTSTGSTGGNGGLWTDFGMQNSIIRNSRLYGTSIHVVGAGGDTRNCPVNNLIEGNYIEGAGSSGILLHSFDSSNFAKGNRIIGNTLTRCDDDCITIGYASSTIVMGNQLSDWAHSTLTNNYAIQVYGVNTIIMGNAGKPVFYTVWLKESGTTFGNANTVLGNNFPGCTLSASPIDPVSGIFNFSNGVTTTQGVIQVGDGTLPSRLGIKTVTSSSNGSALTVEEQDILPAIVVRSNNNSYATDLIYSSTTFGGSTSFNFLRGVTGSTTAFKIDGLGGFQIGSRTLAQMQAASGITAGTAYYCSNCTEAPVCISTGTAANSFVEISSRTTPCQ